MAIKREVKTKARNGKWSTRVITVKPMEDYLNNVFVAENGCNLWLGSISADGYAYPRIDGKLTLLHRAAYADAYGPIPDLAYNKLMLCHSCGNRLCINPQHLYIGTAKSNAVDMVNHGKAGKLKGEAIGNSKLIEKDVMEIRQSTLSAKELSEKHNITIATVSNVRNKKTWRHV